MRKQYGVATPAEWPRACEAAVSVLQDVLADDGRLGALVSPMLGSEEAFLLGRFLRGLDEKAVLGVGPVPVEGEDKSFPGGYTVRAEKAPNARGVRRGLELLGGEVVDADAFTERLGADEDPVRGVLVTGNYPSDWPEAPLVKAIGRKHTLVLIDTLPTALVDKADVVLPSATWLEKAGSFENAENRIQSFEPAISPIVGTRPEGQVALELMAAAELAERGLFDAEAVRMEMGGLFVAEIYHPAAEDLPEPELEYVEL